MRRRRGGDFAAASLIAEADAVCDATESRIAPFGAVTLASFQGREAEAVPLIQATIERATARGQGVAVTFAHWAAAVRTGDMRLAGDALDLLAERARVGEPSTGWGSRRAHARS